MGLGDKVKGLGGAVGNASKKKDSAPAAASSAEPSGSGQPSNFNEEYKKTFFSSGGSGGGGGGGGKSPPWKMILMICLVIGIIIIVAVWFVSTGGLQASSGIGYQFDQILPTLLGSVQIRALVNWVQNPFSMGPTGGQYEELQPADTTEASAAPNQAYTLETRGFTTSVANMQNALSLFIKVTNSGANSISKLSLTFTGNYPQCVNFTDPVTGVTTPSNKLLINVYNVAPSASKEVTVSGGTVDFSCIKEKYWTGVWTGLKPNIMMDVYVGVIGYTYYTTSSRLAVERINTHYGELLFQNDVLKQESVGATYQAGTALSINLDAGSQPILDTVNVTGVLMNWVNNGAGHMPKGRTPLLFIITPYDFGQCRMNLPGTGLVTDDGSQVSVSSTSFGEHYVYCDNAAYVSFCSDTGNFMRTIVNSYSSSSDAVFDWACNQTKPYASVVGGNTNTGAASSCPSTTGCTSHVCITPVMTEEFNVFTCNLDLRYAAVSAGENRKTEYITAIAVYPYEVAAGQVDVKAYCTEGTSSSSDCP